MGNTHQVKNIFTQAKMNKSIAFCLLISLALFHGAFGDSTISHTSTSPLTLEADVVSSSSNSGGSSGQTKIYTLVYEQNESSDSSDSSSSSEEEEDSYPETSSSFIHADALTVEDEVKTLSVSDLPLEPGPVILPRKNKDTIVDLVSTFFSGNNVEFLAKDKKHHEKHHQAVPESTLNIPMGPGPVILTKSMLERIKSEEQKQDKSE